MMKMSCAALIVAIGMICPPVASSQGRGNPPAPPAGDPFPIPPIGPKGMPAGDDPFPIPPIKPKGRTAPVDKPSDKTDKGKAPAGPAKTDGSEKKSVLSPLIVGTPVTAEGCLTAGESKSDYVLVAHGSEKAPRMVVTDSADITAHVNEFVRVIGTTTVTGGAQQEGTPVVSVQRIEVLKPTCDR